MPRTASKLQLSGVGWGWSPDTIPIDYLQSPQHNEVAYLVGPNSRDPDSSLGLRIPSCSMNAPSTMPAFHRPANHLPGEAGLWIFVLGDMTIFALLFAVFIYYRNENLEMYLSSQRELNQNFGALNTLLLLTSSWFVALGIQLEREGRANSAMHLFSVAWLCGVGFAIIKIVEYGQKIKHGITLTTNEFFTFYYMLTGIHFMHVTIGLCVLTFIILHLRQPEPHNRMLLEGGATYWHMVDLLWIVLFPLLYLMK
ncbi:MAG: cytochrome oxidase subunit [Nevskia sp.]|nr:cytochrome oxidase subunit [Nevskia sp.]